MSCPISWSIIIKRETTKAKTIFCSSPHLCRRQVREARSVVESGSAAYSNTTAGLHEYFLHTGLTLFADFAHAFSLGPRHALLPSDDPVRAVSEWGLPAGGSPQPRQSDRGALAG